MALWHNQSKLKILLISLQRNLYQANLLKEQEMVRINISILGLSELKWMGIGDFNSDNHYIYYSGQESYWRNGVVLIITK